MKFRKADGLARAVHKGPGGAHTGPLNSEGKPMRLVVNNPPAPAKRDYLAEARAATARRSAMIDALPRRLRTV
jgi:hypothetical protein